MVLRGIIGVDTPGAVNYRSEPQTFRYPGLQNRTGTMTFTNGSTAVTGAGTLFQTELAGGANGDTVFLQSQPTAPRGRVASITTNTQLALTGNATVNADNPASGAVLIKAGFLYTGDVMPRFSAARGEEAPTRMMVWLA